MKFFRYIAIVILCVIVLIGSMSLGICYLIQHNTKQVSEYIYRYTGYKILVANTKVGVDGINPQLSLTALTVDNIKNNQHYACDELKLVLSYSTIWHLKPIFSQISCDGLRLHLTQTTTGNFVLNGIDLHSTGNSSSKITNWLILQQQIIINNITLIYSNQRNLSTDVQWQHLTINMHNIQQRHLLEFYQHTSGVIATLDWQGNSALASWNNGQLTVQHAQPLPCFHTMKYPTIEDFVNITHAATFTHNTPIATANIIHGTLQHLSIALSDDIISDHDFITTLHGTANIDLLQNRYYMIRANKLNIATVNGILFQNANITGFYDIGIRGQLQLRNSNFVTLQYFMHTVPVLSTVTIDGIMQTLDYSWQGNMLTPSQVSLSTSFSDIDINSNNLFIPSVNHISGKVILAHNIANIQFSILNGELNYPYLWSSLLAIKQLNATINLAIESNILNITLQHLLAITPDGSGWATGAYQLNLRQPDDIGYLALQAHVNSLQLTRLDQYLPKQIPNAVHSWLHGALLAGTAYDGEIAISGSLNDFPFNNNSGLFNIKAKVRNMRLNYENNWPLLQLNGNLALHNTKIVIDTNGQLAINSIQPIILENAEAIIANYTAASSTLAIKANLTGNSKVFLQEISKTPVKSALASVIDNIKITGAAKLAFLLNIPLNAPDQLSISGNYAFDNNTLSFPLWPLPLVSATTGELNFNKAGLLNLQLAGTAFAAHVMLTAATVQKKITITATFPHINIQPLLAYYVLSLDNIVDGYTTVTVNATLNDSGLQHITAFSNLIGINIEAPLPLSKKANTIYPSTLNITVNKNYTNLNFQYHNLINIQSTGKALEFKNLQIALGEHALLPHNTSKIAINALFETFSLESWLDFIQKIQQNSNNNTTMSPIDIALSSKHFKASSFDFGAGTANLVMKNNQCQFILRAAAVHGIGSYQYNSNTLTLQLANFKFFHSTEAATTLPVLSSTSMMLPNTNLSIESFYYQDHNLGQVKLQLRNKNNTLYLENGTLINNNLNLLFNAVNYCATCQAPAAIVALDFQADIKNLGNTLYNLDLGRILDKGKGRITGHLQWIGGFFDATNISSTLHAKLLDGKFLQVNPGLWGGLLGILNLQILFEVSSLTIEELFKTGFFFNELNFDINTFNRLIKIENMKLAGPSATVSSTGILNLETDNIDVFVNVIPNLGLAMAVTAGAVTLNPIISGWVYLGELIAGDLQNKLFAVDYHLSGKIRKPTISTSQLSTQIWHNISQLILHIK